MPKNTPDKKPLFAFEEAKEYELRIGKHKGQSLDKIAETDEGLKYLDWLSSQSWLDVITAKALICYLSDESIKKELSRILN